MSKLYELLPELILLDISVSHCFQELLEKAEENSSGEEQWDINFRKFTTQQDTSGKKKKKRVSESNKKGEKHYCQPNQPITIYVSGGSLSNLSNLSDFESGSGKSSSKSKKQRSSVSSRSREGGSLPPTKFENVMLYEAANNSHAWDSTTVQVEQHSLFISSQPCFVLRENCRIL